MVPDPQRIVICGGGIIGCAIADQLALRGARPTVIERAQPAAAASGKAAGFLALDWNDHGPVGPLARLSFALHHRLAEELDDVGYRDVEALQVAAVGEGSVEAYRRFPSPDWLDGNVAVHELIGSPETTAQVDPRRLTRALLDRAVANGAELVPGVVDGLRRDTDGVVTGVVVDGSVVTADVVVLALGPWTRAAAAWVTLPEIRGLKSASMTLAADAPAQMIFCDYLPRNGRRWAPEIYPRSAGEVYVTGYHEDDPLPDDPDDINPSDAACDALRRVAAVHSTALAAAPETGRTACFRPVTIDGIPIIGPVPGAPGVFIATGHGPWGILNGPATGLIVAEMILDGQAHSIDAAPFSPLRLLGTHV
jgi:glycine/D-amino acid oxidase-like deaminating enzyme